MPVPKKVPSLVCFVVFVEEALQFPQTHSDGPWTTGCLCGKFVKIGTARRLLWAFRPQKLRKRKKSFLRKYRLVYVVFIAVVVVVVGWMVGCCLK